MSSVSQFRGDDNLHRNVLKCGKSGADGRGFIIGLFGVIPNGSARAISAHTPYDQLSGLRFGPVMEMVPTVGGRVEQLLLAQNRLSVAGRLNHSILIPVR